MNALGVREQVAIEILSDSLLEQVGAGELEPRGIEEAAIGTSQVAINIAEVNRGAAETGSASAQVLTSAQALSGEGNILKREVDQFLATVRAA
jgi:methyl-accepting chemotaxis protein